MTRSKRSVTIIKLIIIQSYRQLAKKYHPDKNDNNNAQDKFIKVQEAYETLSDPSKRKEYDDYISGYRPNPYQNNFQSGQAAQSRFSQQQQQQQFFQQQRYGNPPGKTFTVRFGDRVFVMENGGGQFHYSSSSPTQLHLGSILGMMLDLAINILIIYYVLSCFLCPGVFNRRPQVQENEEKVQ